MNDFKILPGPSDESSEMDRNLLAKLKLTNHKLLFWGGLVVLFGTVGIWVGRGTSPQLKTDHQVHDKARVAESFEGESRPQSDAKPQKHSVAKTLRETFSFSDLVDTYAQALANVQRKVDELRASEETKRRLLLENANLRLKLEATRFGCQAEKALTSTREAQQKLAQQTGSPVGRILASLQYTPPSNLLPQQLFTLGMSFFKSREDEKAAVIFTHLTELDGVLAYKTPATWLTAGIAWYRLSNFAQAEKYFDQILNAPEAPEHLKYQAHARLWKALTAAKLGKQTKAQYWLRDLMDHHPRSREVKWVNSSPKPPKPKEVERVPASDQHG